MATSLKIIQQSLLHLFYPHICEGCESDILPASSMLCAECLHKLPYTLFEQNPDNPISKKFAGRLSIQHGCAVFYFTKSSLMQHLMHQFKYKGNKALGLQLGRLMGQALVKSGHYNSIDGIVALPLYITKEKKRGFNQSEILANGIAEALAKPVIKDAVIRLRNTESQTKKSRVQRWENMEGKFAIQYEKQLVGKHLLLVDDVVTTGATLEWCGNEILNLTNTKLSIATLCCSDN